MITCVLGIVSYKKFLDWGTEKEILCGYKWLCCSEHHGLSWVAVVHKDVFLLLWNTASCVVQWTVYIQTVCARHIVGCIMALHCVVLHGGCMVHVRRRVCLCTPCSKLCIAWKKSVINIITWSSNTSTTKATPSSPVCFNHQGSW